MTWIKETDRKFESYFGGSFVARFGIILAAGAITDIIISIIYSNIGTFYAGLLLTVVGIALAAYGRIRHVHRNPPHEEPHLE
ncbi:MAG: hypothetical protein SPI12_06430 [Actinomycetaceae bacterium]|nr:hypothetical protein [Actinomycetaceae bacterium]MDY6083474.1 hypothetical protein [Actinomycetaceae bacterium]